MSTTGHKPRIRDYAAERKMLLFRLALAGFFVLGLCGVIAGRLYFLQVRRHDYYSTQSKDNRLRVQVVPPVRGLIYDRDGRILAENVPSYSLVITPDRVPDLKRTLGRLSRLLDIGHRAIEHCRKRAKDAPGFQAIPVKLDLSKRETARFEVHRQDFPGVDIEAGLSRHYPLGASAAHLVGYVGTITQGELSRVNARQYRGTQHFGKTGVEHSYEKTLHGSPGSKIVEVNAQGRELRELDHHPPHSGDNLYLTLDSRLQAAAARALGDHSGAVVALNPQNGAILAMASEPSYNPELFVNGISQKKFSALNTNPDHPLFDRAVQGQYPPGSTIKPVMALAGLNSDSGQYIHHRYCPGWYKLPHSAHIYHGWRRGGHGRVDLHQAIEQSCDVYFYALAHDLGIDRIHAFVSQFGLGHPTGVDLPSEASGLVPSRAWKRQTQGRPWYPGDTLNTGIGQGYMSATPLQLALMTSRIATHGKGARPHILYAWQNAATGAMTPAPVHPLPAIELDSQNDWERVIDGMHAVINNPRGTAHRIGAGLTFPAAGKTGTAQIRTSTEAEKGKPQSELPKRLRDHALFITFAPLDRPRIAVAVLVEHGGYGASVAAPIARKVLSAYLGPQGNTLRSGRASQRPGAERSRGLQ